MSSPSQTVHYTQPGFTTMAEVDGHGDTCGIDVILDYVHITHGIPLTVQVVDILRTQLIRMGLFDHGMTTNNIVSALEQLYNVHPVSFVPYGQVNETALRTDLANAGKAKQAVILETSKAYNLPDNQPGVEYHFICTWGIDSNRGYWTANGDTETALRSSGTTSPVWYTWANIAASGIVSYIILPAVEVARVGIVIETNEAGSITGAHDAHDPTLKLGAGMAYQVQQRHFENLAVSRPETFFDQRSIAALSAPDGGTPQVMTYSQQWNVQVYGGEDLERVVYTLMDPRAPVPASPTPHTLMESSLPPAVPAADTLARADVHAALTKFLEPLLGLIGEDNAGQ